MAIFSYQRYILDCPIPLDVDGILWNEARIKLQEKIGQGFKKITRALLLKTSSDILMRTVKLKRGQVILNFFILKIDEEKQVADLGIIFPIGAPVEKKDELIRSLLSSCDIALNQDIYIKGGCLYVKIPLDARCVKFTRKKWFYRSSENGADLISTN